MQGSRRGRNAVQFEVNKINLGYKKCTGVRKRGNVTGVNKVD